MRASGVSSSGTMYGTQWCLGTCDAILCLSHTMQSALESGQKARIVQIDFSAAFDMINQQGILYKLFPLGIGGSVLSIMTPFLSNRSQHVMMGGGRSKLVNFASGVLQNCASVGYTRSDYCNPHSPRCQFTRYRTRSSIVMLTYFKLHAFTANVRQPNIVKFLYLQILFSFKKSISSI